MAVETFGNAEFLPVGASGFISSQTTAANAFDQAATVGHTNGEMTVYGKCRSRVRHVVCAACKLLQGILEACKVAEC